LIEIKAPPTAAGKVASNSGRSIMNAAEIMTQPVISVTQETKIAEAARLMLRHRISGLPVVDPSGAVVGIVTEGDLLRRSELGTERHRPRWVELLIGPGRLAGDYVDAHARKVGEVMSVDVVSVAPQETLPAIVRLMEKRHIKRLPVIEDGRLVGIVSRANLVRALVRTLARPAATDAKGIPGDAEIRDSILAEIAKQPWGPRFSINVTVENGVAELCGSITDERERIALQVVAENARGVKTVHDRLIWVEPISGMVIPADGPHPS
jgi:CBS domain-containing protein